MKHRKQSLFALGLLVLTCEPYSSSFRLLDPSLKRLIIVLRGAVRAAVVIGLLSLWGTAFGYLLVHPPGLTAAFACCVFLTLALLFIIVIAVGGPPDPELSAAQRGRRIAALQQMSYVPTSSPLVSPAKTEPEAPPIPSLEDLFLGFRI